MKNHLKIFLKTGILLLGVVLVWSCSNDEQAIDIVQRVNKYKVPEIQKAKTSFENNNNLIFVDVKSKKLASLSIDWDDSKIATYKKEESIDILYTPIIHGYNSRIKSFVASIESNNSVESEIITVAFSSIHENKNGLSGYVFRHDIEGNLISYYRYINGKRIGEGSLKNKQESFSKNDFEDCTGYTVTEIMAMVDEVGIDNVICVNISVPSSGGSGQSTNTNSNVGTATWGIPPATLNSSGSSGSSSSSSGATILEIEWWNVDGYVLSFSPFFKYPPNSNYAAQYPKLTEYLKNQLPNLANEELIVDALKQYGSLTEQQIKDALTWGQGPIIEIVDMNCCLGSFGPNFGFDSNTLIISTELANVLENNITISNDALNFFIGVVILHEFTHFGDFHFNGNMYEGEEGSDFELYVSGTTQQDPVNANSVYQGYLLRRKN